MNSPGGVISPEMRNAVAGSTVVDAILRTSRKDPSVVALIFEERAWTYGELATKSERWSQTIRGQGVRRGDRIVAFGQNSVEYLTNWLGILLAGAIHVPVNFMYEAREVRYVLEHCEASVAFADHALIPVLEEAARNLKTSLRIGLLESDSAPREVPGSQVAGESPRTELSEVAQIAYTSGTESSPKGVMLSHSGLLSQYVSCIVAGSYTREDRVLHSLPLYHAAQMHCFMMPYLWLGATNVLIPRSDPAEIMRAIEDHSLTSMFAPPTVWIGLLRHPDFEPSRLRSLRKGYYGASIMPMEVIRELSERLPGVSLWNYYGQTEMSPLATVLYPSEQMTKTGAAGRPVLNVETRVVNDDLESVAIGEIGEIVHRSPQLMVGYFRDEVKTGEAFEGGWFHSGDLASVDEEGFITIIDRKKDVIKTGGENVSSREVEEVLYEHPGCAEIAVIGIPDEKWIEAVCAVVVRRVDISVSEDEIIEFAKTRLARFKVPKRVVFVDTLPKSPSGKILKRELREDADVVSE